MATEITQSPVAATAAAHDREERAGDADRAVGQILAVIERAATNPQVDIEKMERLLLMHERIVMRKAEADFHAAMSAAQSEMTRIARDMENTQTRSRYASYGQLDRHLRPIYTRHGFSLSYGTDPSPIPDHVLVFCDVSHIGGFSKRIHIDIPADGKGAKGGDVMTKTHATVAASSYGMRTLLRLTFNVAIGEDDTDGNLSNGEKITNDQFTELMDLIRESGSSEASLMDTIKCRDLTTLPASAYPMVKGLLETKRDRKRKVRV